MDSPTFLYHPTLSIGIQNQAYNCLFAKFEYVWLCCTVLAYLLIWYDYWILGKQLPCGLVSGHECIFTSIPSGYIMFMLGNYVVLKISIYKYYVTIRTTVKNFVWVVLKKYSHYSCIFRVLCDDMHNKINNKRCDGCPGALSIIGVFKGSVGIMGVEEMIGCANDWVFISVINQLLFNNSNRKGFVHCCQWFLVSNNHIKIII